MPETEVRVRKTRRFSWAKVPERTLQSIVLNLGNRDDPRVQNVVRGHGRKKLEKQKNLVALIGLTATPRPTSASARVKVRERFGQKPVITVQKETLIKDRILARPRLITVETNQVILVTVPEARRAVRDDFSPEFMRQLANDERDKLVVSTWLRDREKWGAH